MNRFVRFGLGIGVGLLVGHLLLMFFYIIGCLELNFGYSLVAVVLTCINQLSQSS